MIRTYLNLYLSQKLFQIGHSGFRPKSCCHLLRIKIKLIQHFFVKLIWIVNTKQKSYQENLHKERILSCSILFPESLSKSCLGSVPVRLLFPIIKKRNKLLARDNMCTYKAENIYAHPYN